jgi:hypothetical protein
VYQLFRPHHRFIKGVLAPGATDYIKRIYQSKLVEVREYYSTRTNYLKNDHILVRLLTTGLGSLHTDYRTFVSTAIERSGYLIRFFEFTGAVGYGRLRHGSFYGDGSHEIIIGDDEDFDVDRAVRDWKLLTPIRVLTHPVSDFNLVLPNGKNNHGIDGLTVIYINIPMLMLQYRMFIEEQRNREDGIISPKLFGYQYVLPNMMASHLDHVFVNRIINLKEKLSMSDALTHSAFFQAEAKSGEGSALVLKVNDAQNVVLDRLRGGQMDYPQVLASIFTVTKHDALDLLIMPSIAPTRQVWWALLLARLKHTKFLLELSKEYGIGGQNRMYEDRAWIDLSRLIDSRVLEAHLPPNILEVTLDQLNATLNLLRS